MSWRTRLLLVAGVLTLASCTRPPVAPDGAQPSAETASEGAEPSAAEPEVAMAPAPFPAAQLRTSILNGTGYRFQIESMDRPTTFMQMSFDEVSEAGATLTRRLFDETGAAVAEPMVGQVTWQELESHAHYRADETTIEADTLELPSGTYECQRYTVIALHEGMHLMTVAWFATSLPGAPVRHETWMGADLLSTMTLVQYTPGTP